jgi:hypothetical protein
MRGQPGRALAEEHHIAAEHPPLYGKPGDAGEHVAVLAHRHVAATVPELASMVWQRPRRAVDDDDGEGGDRGAPSANDSFGAPRSIVVALTVSE